MRDQENLIWKKFPVLNDGFVCLVAVMGNDAAIVQAARVSYGAGTKKTSDDRTLIRYLMRHRHTTPFEMCEVKLLVRVPMDCWRQWIRHRTANVNEYSTRYSEAIDSQQTTKQWRAQSKTNKQGSSDGDIHWPEDTRIDPRHGQEFASPHEYLYLEETRLHEQARRVYEMRLAMGVAREQARKDLPLSTYTEAYWKIDLHNLLHFLSLRMDSHAQQEIREYATIIGEQIVAKLFPLTWEAFVDYRLEGMFLTRDDIVIIRDIMNMQASEVDFQKSREVWPLDWRKERSRERDECLAKLKRLGFVKENVESTDC